MGWNHSRFHTHDGGWRLFGRGGAGERQAEMLGRGGRPTSGYLQTDTLPRLAPAEKKTKSWTQHGGHSDSQRGRCRNTREATSCRGVGPRHGDEMVKSQRVKERGPHCPEALRPSGLRLLQRAAVLVTDCNLETAGLMTWLVPRWAAGCLPLNEPPSPLNSGALLAAPGLPAAGVEQMPGRAASIPVPGFASAVLEVSWARCRCIRWEQQTRHCATLLTFQMICLVNLSNPYRGM